MGQLEHQTAIITGGGTVIGPCIARRFHEEGAFVVICGRTADVLDKAAREIAPGGERVLAVRADITGEEDVQNLVARTMAQTGQIDVLVNNAAAMRCNKPPEESSLEERKFVIDTNVNGIFLCSREVGKVMIGQKSGRIINIASMSGLIVMKNGVVRSAVIGAGLLGMRHAEFLAGRQDAKLVAVADVRAPVPEMAASKTGASPYTNYQEMLAREKLDLVLLRGQT